MAFSINQLIEVGVSNVTTYLIRFIWVIVIIVIGGFVIKIVKKAIDKSLDKAKIEKSLKTFIESVVGFVLWIVILIIILANLGVDVSGLIAGLGVMGFIVGFALKDTLGNLASGFFILYHKPFRVGEWVKIGGKVGGVERIGISACTLKAPDGTKITMPNSKIWGGTIENFSGNPIRKIYNLEVGISYGDDIGKAIKIIQEVLKKDKRVLRDPEPQVVVKTLGDNSVNIAVRPSVKKDNYWGVYFDAIRNIKEEFDKNKITIPFPQRTVWMKR